MRSCVYGCVCGEYMCAGRLDDASSEHAVLVVEIVVLTGNTSSAAYITSRKIAKHKYGHVGVEFVCKGHRRL